MNADDIAGILGDLGSTPDEVAKNLEAMGLRGKPGNRTCPVAIWVDLFEFDGRTVKVTKTNVHLLNAAGRLEVTAALPRPVLEFVNRYDLGMYPNLLAPEST